MGVAWPHRQYRIARLSGPMPKPRLIDNISVYANATEAERMEYARYLANTRAAGRTPEAFADWQRDREAPSSETQCPA
jgi:hypothetical protein